MSKPNFFIIGSAKSGTTSLASLLSENPSVCFSDPKETRFFSKNYHKGIQFYENKYFRNANHPLIGEGDVSYFHNPKAAERIVKHYPEAKIIVLLRNPMHRAFSGYLMGVRAGRFQKPFMETLEVNLEQLKLFEEEKLEYSEIKWEGKLLLNGHYLNNIKRFLKFWPQDKMKIIIFERLMANTKPVLEPCAEEFLYHYYKKRVQDLKYFLNDDIKEWSDFDKKVD